ncbi:E3 ubiquitin-protein ligase ZSWIM2 [Microcaecilia unicolor]|uniref:E3 ubiquitin-protein ligase ZSWIM2 n=1 Tax=Microcaecilia unicolor TaxID=1415580 RepID=A0A6P7YL39_9AMPH|nr:E3 ubiquitin-protein ligase ZSWIM2 [Microcaecilia unicolor]XP_030065511.1 E3 ubiquitin-protein ligase ZSWIM2 [Microcaecilia unicolor]XP_030065512.1 E3 ubiquitin-protein ligase ZSWIM2 [Microcaecilia unicolor]
MSRRTGWRRTINEVVSWRQDQALSTTIYIIREFGPTGFLLKEDEELKNFKVFLGDPHSCSCSTFVKEKDLCKHICWILLKKFKLPRDHEYAFQVGLVEREINEVLQGLHRVQTSRPAVRTNSSKTLEKEEWHIKQKDLDAEDVCPICQEELLKKKLPVTYCRNGCGNNVHIACMKIWADHQTTSEHDSMVKCPLCREEFAPLKLLAEEVRNSSKLVTAAEKERLDRHLGVPCNNCRALPIEGKCYRCVECINFHLCQECFTSSCHAPHLFVSRQKRNQRWRPVEQFSELPCDGSRESTKEELLNLAKRSFSLPKHILKSFPVIMVRRRSALLNPGQQCRICLKAFSLGQHARHLSCNHKFHRECIDSWLLFEDNSCPVDGQVLYNPLTWKVVATGEKTGLSKPQANTFSLSKQQEEELFIPGIGLSYKQMKFEHAQGNPPGNNQWPTGSRQPLPSKGLSYLSICEPSSKKDGVTQHTMLQPPRYVQDLSLAIFKKPLSQKPIGCALSTKDVVSSKDSFAHVGVLQQSNKQNGRKEHLHQNEVFQNGALPFKGRKPRKNMEVSDLNLEDDMCIEGFLLLKGDTKYAEKYRPQRGLPSRRPL